MFSWPVNYSLTVYQKMLSSFFPEKKTSDYTCHGFISWVKLCVKRVLKTLTIIMVICVEMLWAFSSFRKKEMLSDDNTTL